MPDSQPAAARAACLAVLAGQRPARPPAFSGLIHVTTAGLEAAGWPLAEVHHHPERLAAAAASAWRLSDLPSAVAPLDLCLEAELLGAQVNFGAQAGPDVFPYIQQPAAQTLADLAVAWPAELETAGRLPIVLAALRQLRAELGDEIVIGGYLPGPFTLLSLLLPPGGLYDEIGRPPPALEPALAALADGLARVGALYRAAGADFLTVHEMGGSPGMLGPRRFKAVVLPALQRLFAALPGPRVLSVCGRTGPALPLLAEAGADALSVDQLTDLAQARAALGPNGVLLGNLDPVALLAQGAPADIATAATAAVRAGVDALWPGCDLWPPTPTANLRALAASGRLA